MDIAHSTKQPENVAPPNKDSGVYLTEPAAEEPLLRARPSDPAAEDRIFDIHKYGNCVQDDRDTNVCSSDSIDDNGSKISSCASHFSHSGSSTRDTNLNTNGSSKTSLQSCGSCCSKSSYDSNGERKSPVIHVKLYSSGTSTDSNSSSKNHSHMLCHKVPLSSLTCCSECKLEENGSIAPCSCLGSSHCSLSSSNDDKKSTCSSIQSNLLCSCNDLTCTCTKTSQITCEVDLVFEGENVKNVPMKNEIIRSDIPEPSHDNRIS